MISLPELLRQCLPAMRGLFSIFIGAGIGGVLRYFMIELVKRLNPAPFPMGTLLVNVLGSLLMGALMAWVLRDGAVRDPQGYYSQPECSVGSRHFLPSRGMYYSYGSVVAVIPALTYVAGSLFLSLIAVAVGYIIVMKAGIV